MPLLNCVLKPKFSIVSNLDLTHMGELGRITSCTKMFVIIPPPPDARKYTPPKKIGKTSSILQIYTSKSGFFADKTPKKWDGGVWWGVGFRG